MSGSDSGTGGLGSGSGSSGSNGAASQEICPCLNQGLPSAEPVAQTGSASHRLANVAAAGLAILFVIHTFCVLGVRL